MHGKSVTQFSRISDVFNSMQIQCHNNMILPIQAQCMLLSSSFYSVDSLQNKRNAQGRLMRFQCSENHLQCLCLSQP